MYLYYAWQKMQKNAALHYHSLRIHFQDLEFVYRYVIILLPIRKFYEIYKSDIYLGIVLSITPFIQDMELIFVNIYKSEFLFFILCEASLHSGLHCMHYSPVWQ